MRDFLALVAAVDFEVLAIDGDDAVARVELAQPDQTQIGEVRAVGVATGQDLSSAD